MRQMILFALAAVMLGAVPEGWFLSGNRPQEYECSRDMKSGYQNMPSAYLRSKPGIKTTGFGTLMQKFDASAYCGKRVRFDAYIRSEDVTEWAGLWMRVDNSNVAKNVTLAFDNMQQRAIRGTTDWQNYAVVLDVPDQATGIFLGVLLTGPGAVWMSGGKFEVVGENVPVTNMIIPSSVADAQPEPVVTKTNEGIYEIVLPATARWGASIPNPTKQDFDIFNVRGRVCWDPNPAVRGGCNGAKGSGRIPLNEMSQPEDFLAPDKSAGSLVTKWEKGRTYFSVNDRFAAFGDNEGYFEF